MTLGRGYECSSYFVSFVPFVVKMDGPYSQCAASDSSHW